MTERKTGADADMVNIGQLRRAEAEIERLRASNDTTIKDRIIAGHIDNFIKQEAEIERLRAALQEITDLCKHDPVNPFLADDMQRVASKALAGDGLRAENKRLRTALNPETVARKLAYELGYTWGSSGFRQDEFIEHVRAALAADAKAGYHKPQIGGPPCPTCGFVITSKKAEPFHYDDDDKT